MEIEIVEIKRVLFTRKIQVSRHGESVGFLPAGYGVNLIRKANALLVKTENWSGVRPARQDSRRQQAEAKSQPDLKQNGKAWTDKL